MGWKASLIFIDNVQTTNNEQNILSALNQEDFIYTGDASFEEALNAEKDKTYIASLNNVLIIGTAEAPVLFISDYLSDFEKTLADYFNNSEICGITLQSNVNHWGYGIIKNNEKIRVSAGNYAMPLIADYGTPVEEEHDLLSKVVTKEDGSKVFIINNEEYQYDMAGENLVFEIAKRYTGHALNSFDNPLQNLTFKCYEKSPYFDNTTKASSPGQLILSEAKFIALEPEQYDFKTVPLKDSDGNPADLRKYAQTALHNGACNPAYVFQLKPLIIIAYAYDIDCIIPLYFPSEYQPPFEPILNQRLLTVNLYGTNNNLLSEDLIEGKNSTNYWKNFVPHIAELYSDDTAIIEQKKAEITEELWQKLPLLAKEYFQVNPNRYRFGLNGYSGFPKVYTRPQTPNQAPKSNPEKKWWKLW